MRQLDLTALATAAEATSEVLERLAALRALSELVAIRQAETVRAARAAQLPWSAIGGALGVTRQAAQGRLRDPAAPAADSAGSPDADTAAPKAAASRTAVKCSSSPVEWVVRSRGGRTLLRLVPVLRATAS